MIAHLRKVNFSPLSGGKRNPSTVIKLIKTHGTKLKMSRIFILNENIFFTNYIDYIIKSPSTDLNCK
jgi:hypothetical protein